MVSDVSWKEIQKAGKDFIEFIKSRVGTDSLAIPIVEDAVRIACGDGIKVTERGWAGHFIASRWCRFRRNTLIAKGEKHVVVSTVGNYHPGNDTDIAEVGAGRYYETMVFEGKQQGKYIDAEVIRELSEYFNGLSYKSPQDFPDNVDNLANDMHEATVASVVKALQDNTLPPPRKRYDDED